MNHQPLAGLFLSGFLSIQPKLATRPITSKVVLSPDNNGTECVEQDSHLQPPGKPGLYTTVFMRTAMLYLSYPRQTLPASFAGHRRENYRVLMRTGSAVRDKSLKRAECIGAAGWI